jgi:ABC-type phosphate/phosphonate transport system substrate-binding protein
MFSSNSAPRLSGVELLRGAGAIVVLFGITFSSIQGQQNKPDIIRIGVTQVGPGSKDKKKEDAALESLRTFIQEETGFKNEIFQLKDWRELAARMAKKDIHLGAFQGAEFAWASEKTLELKPLALAVNVYVNPIVYVVVNKSNPAKDFDGLKGQSLAAPDTGQMDLRLFLEKESQERGKSPELFFAKITSPDNVEDALDDVVDGVLQGVVADRTALDAFKRRKPGRFAQLKEVARSQPFPPSLIAYAEGVLDEKTLMRFQAGLLDARHKEKGQTMLTLFKLTGFEKAPSNFDDVLTQTRKTYLPPRIEAK